jgi:hypothetical protein
MSRPFTLALALACVMATPAMAASPIDAYKAETEAMLHTEDGHLACFPLGAEESRVYLITTYYGGEQVDPAQPAARAQAVRYSDVRVPPQDKPVLIVAVAYEPQVWRFVVEPGAKIAGVLLLGAYEQYASGLPSDTKLGRVYGRNRDNTDAALCGDPEAADARDHIDLQSLEGMVRSQSDQRKNRELRLSAFEEFANGLKREGADAAALAIAEGILQRERDRAARQDERASEAGMKLVEAQDTLANPDAEGRLPDPFDGWFRIETTQDLEAFAAGLAILGPYEFAGYEYREDMREGGFVIGATGDGGVPSFSGILPSLRPAS